MVKFTVHMLALARFRGYPQWFVRIVEVIDPKGSEKTRNYKYLVFFYGKHDTQFVNESQIIDFGNHNYRFSWIKL